MMDLREDKKMSKGHRSSLSVEEASARKKFGDEVYLKKGPWTSAEDAILVEYVKKHGEGNWNAVQKHSGLARCGKSCRLRWANHLRPDLKKGAFTQEEEDHIVELHAKFGNKWARMAAELPGRTDNEIKNFWNTRIKKMQRAGLPLYPAEVCLRVLNQENHNMGAIVDPEKKHPDHFLAENCDIPEVEFKSLKFSREYLNYAPTAFDVPESSELKHFADTNYCYSSMLAALHPPKRLRESDTVYHYLDGSICNAIPVSNQYEDCTDENLIEPLRSYFPCDVYADTSPQFLVSNPLGSHAFSNGNYSSSEPVSLATKSELPSLQYLETQHGSWGTPMSPLLSLESMGTLIQSPQTEQSELDIVSPRSSGLLEAIVHESRMLIESRRQPTLINSTMPCLAENSSLKCGQKQCAEHRDPNSPLGHSAASVLSEHTPVSISSVDKPRSIGATQVKEVPSYYIKKKEKSKIDLTRPDALLDLGWFTQKTQDQLIFSDAMQALRGENFDD